MPDDDARMEWVHNMRRMFSPADMIAEDGSILQDFFKPKQVMPTDRHAAPACYALRCMRMPCFHGA